MIIVILGGTDSLREDVVKELTQPHPSKVQHLNVSHCHDVYARLVAEFTPRKHKKFITVITGIKQPKELAFLRKQQAIICHCYGQLTQEYNQISIKMGEYHVLPNVLVDMAPEHVLTPLELLSECSLKG